MATFLERMSTKTKTPVSSFKSRMEQDFPVGSSGNFDIGIELDKQKEFSATEARLKAYQPRADVPLTLQRELVKRDRESEIEGLAPRGDSLIRCLLV